MEFWKGEHPVIERGSSFREDTYLKRGNSITMKVYGSIKFKEAIIVDEELLRKLEDVILQFFKKMVYKCSLYNDSYIEFDSLEELLHYENNKLKRITTLKIEFDYNEISFETISSWLCSYKYTVFGVYKVNDADINILFSKKVTDILKNNRRSKLYTFLTKISTFHFWICILGISIISTIYSIAKDGIDSEKIYTINILNIGFIIGILLVIVIWLITKCRNILLPPISYMIGKQIEVINRKEDLLSKIFWGVIVAFIVSLIVALITK